MESFPLWKSSNHWGILIKGIFPYMLELSHWTIECGYRFWDRSIFIALQISKSLRWNLVSLTIPSITQSMAILGLIYSWDSHWGVSFNYNILDLLRIGFMYYYECCLGFSLIWISALCKTDYYNLQTVRRIEGAPSVQTYYVSCAITSITQRIKSGKLTATFMRIEG